MTTDLPHRMDIHHVPQQRPHATDPQDALDEAKKLLTSATPMVASRQVDKVHAYAHLADVWVRLAAVQAQLNASAETPNT